MSVILTQIIIITNILIFLVFNWTQIASQLQVLHPMLSQKNNNLFNAEGKTECVGLMEALMFITQVPYHSSLSF